jgi:hypothetical protein
VIDNINGRWRLVWLVDVKNGYLIGADYWIDAQTAEMLKVESTLTPGWH